MSEPSKDEDSSSKEDSTREYTCELCDKSFDSEKGLKIHKSKKHSSEVCSYCGEPFGEELPFTCKYCGEKFCEEHRLPENHECEEVEKEKEKVRKGEKPMFPKKSKKVEKKERKPISSVSTPSFDFENSGGLKRKLKGISWGKVIVALIVLFVLLSVWKPAKVKKVTPDPVSPYVSQGVNLVNSMKEKAMESVSGILVGNPVENKCLSEVRDKLEVLRAKTPDNVNINIANYETFNLSKDRDAADKYAEKWAMEKMGLSGGQTDDAVEKDLSKLSNNLGNNDIFTVVVIRVEGRVNMFGAKGNIAQIVPVICDKDGLMENSRKKLTY